MLLFLFFPLFKGFKLSFCTLCALLFHSAVLVETLE